MEKGNATQNLSQTILLLEQKKTEELQSLQQQYLVVYESVKPLNLVKSALNKMTTSPDLKHNILNTVIGLSTGYISKKLLLGSTHNPIKRILGTVLQFAVTNLVARRNNN
ncbi:hypothetical protein [Flavobacterium frigoris]|uniref:Uncharacterized protein n=1 Tax=Flavobacterium frigoris TaxID=229204 RepID=A0A1H9PS74_FLAFI|nr:hypothetical protein [Flavobacterium frigoris]SER51166.1 hypothetical protein SAMN05444355_11432 [Flavobacterium frigoris]